MCNVDMRRAIAIAVLMFGLAAPAWAGFDEGLAAYERRDYATALREFRPLADQGDAKAQHHLGNMYLYGHGVAQDYAAAFQWYRKAAEHGYVHSALALGYMYDDGGQGVPQDYVQAHKWYNIASAFGGKTAKLGINMRNTVSKRMTPADISKAQRLAREWWAKHGKK